MMDRDECIRACDQTTAILRQHGVYPGHRFEAEIRGRVRTCVFSRIGRTGRMICHEEGEPDMQSSWAWKTEDFLKHIT